MSWTYAQQADEQDSVRRAPPAAAIDPRHAAPVGTAPSSSEVLAFSGLRGRGSSAMRAAALQVQQQTYGNRAVQRFVQQAGLVQRQAAGAAPATTPDDLTTPQSDAPVLDSDLAADVAARLGIPASAVGAVCRVWGGPGLLPDLRDTLARGPWLFGAGTGPPVEDPTASNETAAELAPADLAAALEAVTQLRAGVQLAADVGQLRLPAPEVQAIDARLKGAIARLQRAWEQMQTPSTGGPRDLVITSALGELGKVIAKGAADDGIDADDKQRRKLRYGWRALDSYFKSAVGAGHYDREMLLHKLAFGEKDLLPRWGGVFALWAYKQAGMGAVGPWRLGENILSQPGFRPTSQLEHPYTRPRKGDIGMILAEGRHFLIKESPWDANPNADNAPLRIIEGDATAESGIVETDQEASDVVLFSSDELNRS